MSHERDRPAPGLASIAVQAVESHLRKQIGPEASLVTPPGYAHLSLAVIDSIWSLNARYTTVERVLAAHTASIDSDISDPATWPLSAGQRKDYQEYLLLALLLRCEKADGERLAAEEFGGYLSRTPGARTYKADAVKAAVKTLIEHDIGRREDLVQNHTDDIKRAWLSIPGLGPTSWRYLLNLSGIEEIKPDRMVVRFVQAATGTRSSPAEAADLLEGAAKNLHGSRVSLRAVDHTVWRHQSGRS